MDIYINFWIKIGIASYKLRDTKYITLKYEINNKYKRIFKDWNYFIKFYKTIPDKYKYFYEVIGDYCKFFLKINAKIEEIEFYIWKKNILIIKEELKIFFKKKINKEIDILEYNTLPNDLKYSCHLIITDYIFKSEECKKICDIFLNEIKNKSLINIINNKCYGKNKCLRIEDSIKINSNRKKMFIHNNNIINNEIINLKGLVTNIENTELLLYDDFLKNKTQKINLNNFSFECQDFNFTQDINTSQFSNILNFNKCFYCNEKALHDEDVCQDCLDEQQTQYIYIITENVSDSYVIDLLKIEKNLIKDYTYNTNISYVKYIINIENKIKSICKKKESNLNFDITGYLYIIKTRESIRMNENIYKIGCTEDITRRYRQYPKGSKLIYTIIHNDYKNIEKKWIKTLNDNKNLIKRKDMGNEYYEGDYILIINELTRILYLQYIL